jgi:hypothetical protein
MNGVGTHGSLNESIGITVLEFGTPSQTSESDLPLVGLGLRIGGDGKTLTQKGSQDRFESILIEEVQAEKPLQLCGNSAVWLDRSLQKLPP